MRTLLRYIRRALAAIAIVLALCAGAALIFTRTAEFNSILRDKAVAWLARTYRGRITVARIEGSIWGNLALDGVAVSYRGRPVAEIPRVEISYSLTSLIWRVLHLEITAESPRLNLVREPDGAWNLLDALADRVPKPPSSTPLPIAIDLDILAMHHGSILIAPRGESGPKYALAGLQLDSSIDLNASGLRANLRNLETAIAAPGMPPARVRAALAYQDVSRPATLDISAADLSTPDSSVSLTGEVRQSPVISVDATVAIQNLAAADVARIYPASPLLANLSGTIRITGPENALHAAAAISAAGATLDAAADTDITQKSPPYSAKLTLGNAAISKLARVAADGVISAKIDARGSAADLAATTAHIELHGRKMTAAHYALGAIDLTAALAQKNVRANAAINAPAGQLKLDGDASIEAAPRYHLALAGRHLDLARAGAGGASTDVNLNAAIDGRGIKPATMDARLAGNLANSRLDTLTITRGSFDLRVADNRADIRRINVNAAGAALDASGYAGLATGAQTRIAYHLRAPDIAPVLKLAHQSGGGSLDLKGVAAGTLAALKTRGAASFDSLRLAANSIDRGGIRYDLAATGPGAPYGDANISLGGVKAGLELRAVATDIHAARGTPHAISIRLNVEDNAGRHDSAAADFTLRPSLITGHLTQLAMQLPSGDWRLAAPAEFRRDPRSITLKRMELQSGAHEILADGTIALAGPQNFQVIVSRFDFAALRPLAPQYKDLAGTLSARVSITGTAAAPDLYLELDARGLRAQSRRIGDLSAVLKYQPDRAAIDAVLRQDAAGQLTVSGTVPMALQWAGGFKAQIRDGIDLHINSPRLDLAQAAALIPNQVRDFHGVASLNLALRGSLSHPAPSGNLRAAGVSGEIVPLGVKISEMHAGISVNPQEVRVTVLEIHSGAGVIHAGGAIGLNDYTPGAVALNIKFDQWPAIHTQQYQANIGGELAADGSLTHPRVHGALEVLNATIIPDLSFLTSATRLAPDDTITVIQPGQNVPLPESNIAPAAMPPPLPAPVSAPRGDTYNNLAMDVSVVIHRDTWIRHQYAVAELEGHLKIEKRPQGPLRISGMIQTVRGWLDYQNRRFTLQTGQIEFTGGRKIDPSLNIDAQYTVSSYVIDVLVGGVASKPTLRFTSAPELSQADILALLLFGKTTSSLGQGQQADLQQQAAKMATGFAARQAGQAIANSMGLQSLGIELSDVGTSGGTVGIGHYIGENTYVSASQTVGAGAANGTAANTNTVSVQYFITHWLSITTRTASDGSHELDLSIIKRY
jgi:translocation and assembly module TamB